MALAQQHDREQRRRELVERGKLDEGEPLPEEVRPAVLGRLQCVVDKHAEKWRDLMMGSVPLQWPRELGSANLSPLLISTP